MSKQHLLIAGLIMVRVLACAGQEDLFYKTYKPEAHTPGIRQDPDSEMEIIRLTEVFEYSIEEDGFFEYYLYHQTEQIHSAKQLEQSNKKYIPLNGESSLVEASARVIKENGKELVLAQSDILTSYDEEDGQTYKYFALEGLELGNYVDVYYVVKRSSHHRGVSKYFQGAHPIQEYRFEVISPGHLLFAFKVYNDTSGFSHQLMDEEKNRYTLVAESVPALIEEDMAPYNRLRKQFVFKLNENTATNKNDFISFGEVSQNMYRNMYGEISKQDLKAMNKLMGSAGVEAPDELESKIRKLEYAVKENVNVSEANGVSSDIADMIGDRQASSYGMTRLMLNIFKLAGIEHEIVITSDRDEAFMDADFESYHTLQDYLVYFPGPDKYLVPDRYEFRFGLVPYVLTDTKGLFVREVTVGSFTTGLGEVKYIEPMDYEDIAHDHVVQVSFAEDLGSVDLYFEQISTGYYAVGFQAYLDKLDLEIKEELAGDMIRSYYNDITIRDWEFRNGNAQSVGRDPLVLACHGNTSELIEFAGNNLLLRVGDLIGPQVEIYSEDERRLPIYDIYKRSFDRILEVEIPDGYKVRNMDDLKMSAEFVRDGRQLMLFESIPRQEGNRIIIDLNEFYDQMYVELDEYAEYRHVVNSAADFNKVKLILEKVMP